MKKLTIAVAAVAGLAAFATVAISAEDPAAVAISVEDPATAVAERREMMKETVRPNAKLGGDMVKGKVPFDAAKAEEAMAAISEVPDKYVTMFPEGSEYGKIEDSEAAPEIWEDFDGFKAVAKKLKDASAKAASAAQQGKGTFTAAFKDMTKVCKECHKKYRVKQD